jgi:hypothetical protein
VRRTTKLIGAGMPRTGTLTQKMALEMLGLGPCYHMVDVLSDLDQATLWERSMRQTVWAVPHGESLVRPLSSAQAHGTPRWRGFLEMIDRLLVWSVGEGWGPLCEFLELPVPDVPFPHINDRKEFLNRIIDGSLQSLQEWRAQEASVEPAFAVDG